MAYKGISFVDEEPPEGIPFTFPTEDGPVTYELPLMGDLKLKDGRRLRKLMQQMDGSGIFDWQEEACELLSPYIPGSVLIELRYEQFERLIEAWNAAEVDESGLKLGE